MEVNVRNGFYQSVIDRNLYYTFQSASHVLKEKETYDNIPYTFLINFNTFFVNRNERNIFEEFTLQDKYGMILSEKYKVLNINIAECYNLWYDNKYQGMFEPLVEDLVLLCASMMVSREEDFKKIIEMVQIKPEIKLLMEGMIREMSHDEKLVTEYTYWKDENERINASIISEVKTNALKEGFEQGIKEGISNTVINMHQDNLSLELISKYTNLSLEEIKDIINNK